MWRLSGDEEEEDEEEVRGTEDETALHAPKK